MFNVLFMGLILLSRALALLSGTKHLHELFMFSPVLSSVIFCSCFHIYAFL